MNLYLKFLIICSLCILSNIQLNALVYTDNDDKKVDDIIPIIVRENSQDFQRSISAGIEAYYYSGHIYISIYTTEDINGYIKITHLSSGEHLFTNFDESMRFFSIDISEILMSGEYIIQFICHNTHTYEGSFML